MSTTSYSSHTLHLKIGRSRLRVLAYTALCATSCFALVLLFQRGFSGLVTALIAPISILLWRLRVDPAQGLELRCNRGGWTLFQAGAEWQVEPGTNTVDTPWLIYLDLVPLTGTRRVPVWIHVDSVTGCDFRRLRRRLTLQQPRRA